MSEAAKEARPTFDTTFMAMAYVLSMRSEDPTTKHGAIIVDSDRALLSVGYNGPPRGVSVARKVLESREPGGKYDYMIHAEDNAICFVENKLRMRGGTMYVTGRPCSDCGRRAIQHGITRIVYGNVSSRCTSGEGQEKRWEALLDMASQKGVVIESYDSLGQSFTMDYFVEGASAPLSLRL